MYLLQSEHIIQLHITLAWAAMALGIFTGAIIGMFFHKEDWLGGYNSMPRRLIRLGHIAFFGMSFLNFAFALTVFMQEAGGAGVFVGSYGLMIASLTMPLVCFLSAAKGINRALFSIPVIGTLVMLISVFLILTHPSYNALLENREIAVYAK